MRNLMRKILNKIMSHRPIYVNSSYLESKELLTGKRAVVIGGGTGIGLAIAKKMKASNCDVIIAGRKKYEYDDFKCIQWDVTKIEEISNMVSNIIEKYRNIDILVNAQGICPPDDFYGRTYDISQKDFEDVFRTNVESMYFINVEMCKYFEKNHREGNILNIASTEGLKGAYVPYGLSKASVVSLTKGLGKRMIDKGIVINGIAPGATATKMMNMEKQGDVHLTYLPSKRATTPEEIANLALFLVGDMGKQMCGQVVIMDGGESLHWQLRVCEEKSVNYKGSAGNISTWIIAALREEQFFSLAELNQAIRQKLGEFNKRFFQKKEGSRLDFYNGLINYDTFRTVFNESDILKWVFQAPVLSEYTIIKRLQIIGFCSFYNAVNDCRSLGSIDRIYHLPVLLFMLYRA